MKCGQSIKQAKGHDQIFEIAISGPKSSLLYIIFANFYPIISIDKIQLNKSLGQPNQFSNLPIRGKRY